MRNCKNCKTSFEVPNTVLNKEFCSAKCRLDFPRGWVTCSFTECGKPVALTFRNKQQAKYCNRSCAASETNKQSKRKSREAFCLVCDSSLRSRKNALKYCSRVCMGLARRTETAIKIQQWVENDSNWERGGEGFPSVLRNYLLSEVDHKCPQCGWGVPNPVTGKVILTINHIDGNWQNNRRSNLEVLCYNCHTLTDSFGSLNAGSVSGRRSSPPDRPRRRKIV